MVEFYQELPPFGGQRQVCAGAKYYCKTPGFSFSGRGFQRLFHSHCEQKSAVIKVLQTKMCIPTDDPKHPLKLPTEAYFPDAPLFEDLPHIQNVGSLPISFLKEIGVR